MRDIHRKGIIHNDLKEDNTVVDARGRARLIDFGNANEKGRLYALKYGKGKKSPWLAPEMFSLHLSTPAQDAYSVGYLLSLIAVEMEFPEDLVRITLEFLKPDPDQRLTFASTAKVDLIGLRKRR